MFSKILSAAICGMQCHRIQIEADVSSGLPGFAMVGYLSSQVREAQERVRSALRNSGISLGPRRVVVNLSPANIRKEGSSFDLPIAVAVLCAYGYLDQTQTGEMLFVGELGLDGRIKAVRGVLPIVRHARKHGLRCCFVPRENEREGALVTGIQVIGVSSMEEVIEYLKGTQPITADGAYYIEEIEFGSSSEPEYDFGEIKGQELLKRGAEVAAAGMHNFLMIGPPGAAKSMTAKCLPGILPEMSAEEQLEVSEIYSIAGLLDRTRPIRTMRPCRTPHHTATVAAFAGGGQLPRPGEISLAHRGVLFLDEVPEFSKSVLEVLRQPLEEHQIMITRAAGNFQFPADFMLVAAMNPCKCGHYPDRNRCSCSETEVQQYLQKLSGPLLDRIDISVEAERVGYDDLTASRREEHSAEIKSRVRQAHQRQRSRYEGSPYRFNSDLDGRGVKRFCRLGPEESSFMEQVYSKLELSVRGYYKVIKVARTIADLDNSEVIQCCHLSEAVCYRTAERKFWR